MDWRMSSSNSLAVSIVKKYLQINYNICQIKVLLRKLSYSAYLDIHDSYDVF